MKLICVTSMALTMGAAPAVLGVSPEEFMSTLQRAMAPAVDEAEGVIHSIVADSNQFVLRKADDQFLTLMVNEKTAYTLDGERSTREAVLKIGHNAKVTYEDGTATRVDAFSK